MNKVDEINNAQETLNCLGVMNTVVDEVNNTQENGYLKSSAMIATSNSMALVSSVLGFDIIELWSCETGFTDKKMHCTYAHASKLLIKKYPDLITGHYPNHTKEHKVSPELCAQAQRSAEGYHWRVVGAPIPGENLPLSLLHADFRAPGRTEMAYKLRDETNSGLNVFIVGFSLDVIEFSAAKLKFLSGLGYAIYIAAFELDVEEDNDLMVDGNKPELKELDKKDFFPRSFASSSNLQALDSSVPLAGSYSSQTALTEIMSSAVGPRRMRSGSNLTDQLPDRPLSSHGERIRSRTHSASLLVSGAQEDEIGLYVDDSCFRDSLSERLFSVSEHRATSEHTRISDPASRHSGNSSHSPDTSHHRQIVHNSSALPMRRVMSSSNLMYGLDENPLDRRFAAGAVAVAVAGGKAGNDGSSGSTDDLLSVPLGKLSLHPSLVGDGPGSVPMEIPLPSIPEGFLPTPEASSCMLVSNTYSNMPPTWDPVDVFSYPVSNISIVHNTSYNLTLDDFKNVEHVGDGSNSNIYRGMLSGMWVAIKMIKEVAQHDPVAVHEFDVEHGLLSRISHPNIIQLLGAGRVPRRFIVLEYLDGGSLSTVLSKNKNTQPGFTHRFFRRPTFTYSLLLSKARDIASALHYLHFKCHLGATIIHRDIKPDNIGFTSGGLLKLFDFGLCTCVLKRELSSDAYEMTGNTGSLRYMAPEVALRMPYTEKVDVFSFAVLVWQMARDQTPFAQMNRAEFIRLVATDGTRPKIDKSWPKGFATLLKGCWCREPALRPSFATIIRDLDVLISDHENKHRARSSILSPTLKRYRS